MEYYWTYDTDGQEITLRAHETQSAQDYHYELARILGNGKLRQRIGRTFAQCSIATIRRWAQEKYPEHTLNIIMPASWAPHGWTMVEAS